MAAAATVAVTSMAGVPGTARAVPAAAGDRRLRVADQTSWVADGDTFRVGLAVAPADQALSRLQMTIFDPLSTRSDFNESLSDRIHTTRLRTFDPVAVATLGATPGLSVVVNPKSARTDIPTVRLSNPGVYPMRLDLVDGQGILLDRVNTHLVYTGSPSGTISRLDVALFLPLHIPPAVAPSSGAGSSPSSTAGVPVTGAAGTGTTGTGAGASSASSSSTTTSAAASLAGSSGLAGMISALVAHPDVAVTLVPTPQTIDSLANGSAPDRATLSQVAQAAAATGNQTVSGPYVRLDLPALLAAGLDGEIAAQLSQGAAVLSANLRVPPVPASWVATGPLSPAALDDLAGRGVLRLVTRDDALTPLPAEQLRITPAQPFTVAGRTGRLEAVAADAALMAHFNATQDPVLAAHQLLADMALIQEELPHPKGGRGVAVVPPDGWRPDPAFVTTLLTGLGSSPLLSPVTMDRLFADVAPMQQAQKAVVRRAAAPDLPLRGSAVTDATAIRGARRQLASLSTMLPSGTSSVGEIERLLLISESVDLAERARPAQVDTAVHMIDNLKGLVRLPGNQSITFTARQGLIPITILSNAGYPVRVGVRVTSQKLGFRPVDLPGVKCTESGPSEVCTIELRTHNTTVRVPVVSRTAGVFSLTVALESPDGGLTLDTDTDTVRSTAASGVGIFLSIGAALLLAVWWGRDVRHSRRARQLVPKATDGSASPDLSLPGIGIQGRRRRHRPAHGHDGAGDRAGAGAGGGPDAGPDWHLTPPFGSPVTPPSPVPLTSAGGPAARSPVASAARPALGQVPPPATRSERPPASASTPSPVLAPEPPGPAPSSAAGDEDAQSFSRHATVMAVGTLLSRLTGFGRVLALVWAFRLTGITDAYTVANTAPNVLYDLVLGGVLSATLVPVFVDYLNRDDPDEGWRAVSAVITVITAALVAISAVFWLLAPTVIRFYTALNKTAGAADQRAIGTTLLRLFVPQLFLLGGIAVTTALLNARRHFAAPAFSPVINNLVTIAAIVTSRMVALSITLPGFRRDQSALLILGLGTTAGYLLQFLVQLPPMFRSRFRLRPVWDLQHPAVRTVLRLSLWTFGSVMANQVSFNLIMVLADQKQGDVAVFTTAYQFFQLPYAIFAVSIASVITPDLSEHWAKRDLVGFRRQMARGLRLTLAILVPAAAGYVLLAQPFLQLVFHHGSFSSADAHRIGTVVALFAVGLPGFSAYLLLMRAYQAMQDTRSMFVLYLVENLATLVLAGILYPIMGVKGLALGWVGAYSLGTIVAFAHLRTRTRGLDGQAIVAGLVRVAAATAVMALPVIAFTHVVKGRSDGALLAQVSGGVAAGAAVYLVAARVLGITELASLRRHR